jgi:hypothetical protein
MEDLIYVIVLIAWALFAFYRRSQKKQAGRKLATPTPASHDESDPNPMPTLEEILFGETEDKPGKRVPQTIAPYEEGNFSPQLDEPEFAREYRRAGIASVEVNKTKAESLKINRSEIQKNEISDEVDMKGSSDEAFDIRKAVIYAEILNRPYV